MYSHNWACPLICRRYHEKNVPHVAAAPPAWALEKDNGAEMPQPTHSFRSKKEMFTVYATMILRLHGNS